MISADDIRRAKKSIWLHRGRRFVTGFNVFISIGLAMLIVLMVNYLSYHHFWRWDLSSSDYYRLSGKTIGLLQSLDAEVNVVVFLQKNHAFYDDVRKVMKEYEYESLQLRKLKLVIEFVDPDRDLVRVRELKKKYDLKDTNVIVFESSSRRKYIDAASIFEYEYTLAGRDELKKKAVGFKAEELFTSAIQSVTHSTWPVVYFLAGHGERDIEDTKPSGYSRLARLLRRDNMEVKTLVLTDQKGVPKDCSALVVAGPDRKVSEAESDILGKYLARNGRVFFLIDPQIDTGLDKLLGGWGIKICPEVAVGATLTGRELVVAEYGHHAITRNLKRIVTMFYMPRVLEPVSQEGASENPADRPLVTILATNTAPGWAESDVTQNPPRFDRDTDRPAPVAVALAVEKGRGTGVDVEIKPTRIVALGDSYFVANGALDVGAGGNIDFFMSGMNWLVEREALMGISPKVPSELRLDMDRSQQRLAFLVFVVLVPGVVALFGTVVWFRRRR